MARVITDYLEHTACVFPDKTAFVDAKKSITFSELRNNSLHVAAGIIKTGLFKQPIGIFLDKGIECIVSFLGTAYSGNFYTMIDTNMPIPRIEKIYTTLQPRIIITDYAHLSEVKEFAVKSQVIIYEELLEEELNENDVLCVTSRVTDCDVLYVLFTSGSTGIPKGVITSHRAVISYMEAATDAYNLDNNTIIGNQAPLYFVLSIIDVFSTIKNGGTTHFIPKEYFSFPGQLVRYVAENRVTLLNWVSSALCLVANLKAFKKADMSCVKVVIFGGEIMPVKQLNAWIDALPDTIFVNAYGSTEVTDGATYYIINRRFKETDLLPLGVPFNNTDILLLSDDDSEVGDNEIGELCCRGNNLAYGYYNDPERTESVFTVNPLNKAYKERIYRTGDLVRYNQYGEIEYIGRKDFQIKHMGQRIELGEIEVNASSISGVDENCCMYDSENQRIIMFYTGSIGPEQVSDNMKKLVPVYMVPNKVYRLDEMPHNLNGKIDRAELKRRANESI